MGAAFSCVVETRPWLLEPAPADLHPAGGHILAQIVEFAEVPLKDFFKLCDFIEISRRRKRKGKQPSLRLASWNV